MQWVCLCTWMIFSVCVFCYAWINQYIYYYVIRSLIIVLVPVHDPVCLCVCVFHYALDVPVYISLCDEVMSHCAYAQA